MAQWYSKRVTSSSEEVGRMSEMGVGAGRWGVVSRIHRNTGESQVQFEDEVGVEMQVSVDVELESARDTD